MFRRDLLERVQALAPFLTYDYDPYLVVREDGSLVWMWDAYATTSLFPYSAALGRPRQAQRQLHTERHQLRPQLGQGGHQRLRRPGHLLPDGRPDDPIANTWGKIYGGLFTPGDQMPADLRAHIRYPENLYTVQADVLATYHMTDPKTLLQPRRRLEAPHQAAERS